jgi:ribose transport system substrate-binding protein
MQPDHARRPAPFPRRLRSHGALMVFLGFFLLAPAASAVTLEEAERVVAQASTPSLDWLGPVKGPRAQKGKTIAVVAEDLRNGGVLGVSQGVREAARAIGWQVRIFDTLGTPAGRLRAVEQALAVKPHGVVVCATDARDLEPAFRAARTPLPPVVGWHAAPRPGPVANTVVATNVTTDPLAVARTAAMAVVAQSRGKAGVVIFTDSAFGIAMTKANAMAEVIRACRSCQLLAVRDIPISDSAARTPSVIRELLAAHGASWTHTLAINDVYFDHAVPVLLSAGIPTGAISMVSAGDGSPQAFQRVRAGLYQTATVYEPLNMHGWQVVDELNRLMAGEPVSGFVAPVRMSTSATLARDSGSTSLVQEAGGAYRDAYRRIWNP